MFTDSVFGSFYRTELPHIDCNLMVINAGKETSRKYELGAGTALGKGLRW